MHWYLRPYTKHKVIEAYDWRNLKSMRHRQLWDNIEESNIDVIKIQKDQERKNRTEGIFEEVMAKNF